MCLAHFFTDCQYCDRPNETLKLDILCIRNEEEIGLYWQTVNTC